MKRHREPFAATLAALLVFAGILAPSVMLVVIATLVAAGLSVLVLGTRSAASAPSAAGAGAGSRRGVQNPR